MVCALLSVVAIVAHEIGDQLVDSDVFVRDVRFRLYFCQAALEQFLGDSSVSRVAVLPSRDATFAEFEARQNLEFSLMASLAQK